MTRNQTLAWLHLLAALTFAAAPIFVPFSGFDPSLYPIPQNNPPAQPAGYAFSIWGLIYLWLIVSALFGVLQRPEDPHWVSVRPPLIGSLVLGTLWLPVANVSPLWATALIWAMLLLAIQALQKAPVADRWLLRAPLALYAGWLTAASWVSIALVGAGYGILFGQDAWALIVIAGALLMSAAILVQIKLIPAFAAAVIWALVAIGVKTTQTSPAIALVAGLGAMALALVLVLSNHTSIIDDADQ